MNQALSVSHSLTQRKILQGAGCSRDNQPRLFLPKPHIPAFSATPNLEVDQYLYPLGCKSCQQSLSIWLREIAEVYVRFASVFVLLLAASYHRLTPELSNTLLAQNAHPTLELLSVYLRLYHVKLLLGV